MNFDNAYKKPLCRFSVEQENGVQQAFDCAEALYLAAEQERYRTQLSHLADALEHASGADKVRLTKQQKKLQDQSRELQAYEEKIHHLADQNIELDLDDGVKVNYAKFGDVLAKIK